MSGPEKTPEFRTHPGYIGAFTDSEAEGAIPNGTTVMKQASEDGDANPDGTLGVVLGSVDGGEEMRQKTGARFLYFVEWSISPGCAVATADKKIARPS